jgi:hypothetical protein
MKRYKSIKRNKTKQRRKTRNKRNKRKNKTTKKILRGGDLNKKSRFNCVNRMCKYNTDGEYSTLADCILDCHPPPPPPPPSPPDINSLKLITNFREIRPGKLYILTDVNYPNGDIVFLFLPSLRPKPGKMNKELMQKEIDEQKRLLEINRGRTHSSTWGFASRLSVAHFECIVKISENIIKNYINSQYYDNYDYLVFRMTNSSSPSYNNLCIFKKEPNKWVKQGIPQLHTEIHFNKPFFEYMNEKYTIYEFESWPEEIPKPPLELTPSLDTYDISGDWRVDWDGATAAAADATRVSQTDNWIDYYEMLRKGNERRWPGLEHSDGDNTLREVFDMLNMDVRGALINGRDLVKDLMGGGDGSAIGMGLKGFMSYYTTEDIAEEITKDLSDPVKLSVALGIQGHALESVSNCPSGWYFDRELKQCVKTPSTYYG